MTNKVYVSDMKLVVEFCYLCGVPFAVPVGMQRRWKQTGEIFYCPSGHDQVYGESTEALHRREVAALEKEITAAQRALEDERFHHSLTQQSLTATKGALTKAKKRIANGVCPCCHRQFTNLHRHMTSQHPDYAAAEGTENN